MNNKRLGYREIVLGLKSKCAYNVKNETEESSQTPVQRTRKTVLGLKTNGSSLENGTTELSQTPCQHKSPRSGRKENMVTTSSRVLRSKSQEKPKVQEPVVAPSLDAGSKEKRRKKMKKTQKDNNNNNNNNEFSKIQRHLRYLLSRMNYEQNFIDAYVGEGWKGQSLEKIRPEKELERAKSYIHRYKLKIRDLFKQIDTSCEEGRIPETLYDSEGEIDSEDIFCAKCAQSEVQLDNDIILCDGACERGFHQYCLDPPLLKEQVPPGDEGWLCPACDCKVDCVDLLNDSMGTDLSIEDGWEKVFPETAASGNTLDDNLGLPSDDSEDDDYNPDAPQVEEDDNNNPDGPQEEEDEIDAEDSSSDESDFSSASEDLGEFAKNTLADNLGLPSDDSEDDDFNPDKPDSDAEAKKESSTSDFTSDSDDDDLGDIKNEVTSDEVHGPVVSQDEEKVIEANMENDDFAPITARRNVERLDYKRLHDEAYGNVSSDSSDEDFSDSEAPSKRKNTKGATDMKSNKKQKQSESTPVGNKLDIEDTSSSPAHKDKTGYRLSSCKKFGDATTQRLNEVFKENHYPDRGVKETLVKELNLTHRQVSKWFEKARWRLNHPEGRGKSVKSPLKPAKILVTDQTDKVLGLPSDDSEDDDFDPDERDSDDEDLKENSSSEDVGDIKNELTSDEAQEPVMSQNKESLTEGNMENGDLGPITAKRKVERLDYKKLHDAYGNVSSDSSDEEFLDSEAPSKQKNTQGVKDMKSNKKQKQSESTPLSNKLDVEDTSSSPAHKDSSQNNGNRSSNYKRIGEAATERLNEAFKENHYPDHDGRENLAKELNLTYNQVSKWFENARWRFNHPEGRAKSVKSPLKPAEKVATKQENGVISTAPNSRKRKTNADLQASQMDSSDKTTRRSGRVRAKQS
ncbi:putative transcription factor homeobox-WOX family [Helianthus annuus]|nr:putative transcription factor homeobox-WOX family [Helianthus annuus]KAJ0710761.1 putative transcription factor homeobox-WOX family [Helianthus annuus]